MFTCGIFLESWLLVIDFDEGKVHLLSYSDASNCFSLKEKRHICGIKLHRFKQYGRHSINLEGTFFIDPHNFTFCIFKILSSMIIKVIFIINSDLITNNGAPRTTWNKPISILSCVY